MLLPLSRIIAISPLLVPDARLVIAASRAGALGVLDVGRHAGAATRAIAQLSAQPARSLGVRIARGWSITPAMLPASIGVVVLEAGMPLAVWRAYRVLVQVTSLAEARAAAEDGAFGLIAKGHESGGRVGTETAFVLFQSLVASLPLPLWVQGGIGLHTAAACVAGGAAGVVIDSQLALARESSLSPLVQAAIGAMDGSETVIVAGHRIFTRPDLPVHRLAADCDIAAMLGGDDLKADAIPAGQDAALAKPLADRFRTVAGIVRALDGAIDAHIAAARAQRSLGPQSALAADLRTRYPIMQGPMTRVSDRVPFAKAVADAGGLPFLALALMRGSELETLLRDAARALEGQPWGVGILGFVPAELRDEQLEVVRRCKPPLALIAGGRPAQAQPLEELGIATFLHVPSPGLLDLFLKQGARRFVFEGSECGGHVGPRTSFALWELQIARLLAHPKPRELSVVFAGGIHDARSAAMVAVMAAPLVERGVRIGVLMGTAYLFTAEAVASGAIQPGFQREALACTETVLLETAPGHATRCADTEYVRAFGAERERLEASGVATQQMWLQLEEMNLGRLRIAAKGMRREGRALVAVDVETQRREGMVMLGQVASLRAGVGAIAALHRDVSEGSVACVAALPAPPVAAIVPADVAIIGVAAIMPGAADTATFWANIVNGVNSIREVSPERWRAETFYDAASTNGEMTPSKWGGFLDPVAFDPLVYGIPPLSLAAIEPVQLLALEASRRALDDAGYLDREFGRDRTAVIFGAEAGTDLAGAYGFRALWRQYAGPLPQELDAVLPRMTEDSFPGILANVIAGRIANRLDLGGVNYTVDAACASSLAAVDLACKELAARSSDMVICGGADLHNGIVDYLAFASVHALSPSGQCMTFDAKADGIALGEGVAAVVLKRVADAERDGDRIYAVIKAVGGASDGKSLGLTAPRAEGQARTLDRAYRQAGIAPARVALIEAHGTGTVVGDRTELDTLNGFFGTAGAASGTIALGSVKSQIGHTKCAAGLAGVIKAALSLHHRVLPPTINLTQPNPGWTSASPFTLNTIARPWPGVDRNAGVSAFGFGGTNFHVVLSEHGDAAPDSGVALWPAELFLFRGRDRDEAMARIAALVRVIDGGNHALKDLARSTCQGTAAVQVAVVARDVADLRVKLESARRGEEKSSGVFIAQPWLCGSERKVVFLFPGQGSQRVGMLGDLFIAFPALQRHLADNARWTSTMFPPTPWNEAVRTAQHDALTDTRVAQPALGIAGLAIADVLQQAGVLPDMLAGHSYGELVALCVAGAFPAAALTELSALRGERILAACAQRDDPGTMLAVGADAATASRHLRGLADTVVANDNAPGQCVISGPQAEVAIATARLQANEISARPIAVACAFHSPLVASACGMFAADLRGVEFSAPALPVYSNATAEPYPQDPGRICEIIAEHLGAPVRFAAEIEAMYTAGGRIFVEAGPGRVLTGLVSRILGARPHAAIACDRAGEHGVTQLLLALGQLAVLGVPVDTAVLFAGREAACFDLDAPPRAGPPASAWWVNGQRAWPLHGELPPHAMRPITEPVLCAPIVPAVAARDERQAVVLEYLRGVREMVDAQRRVVLQYLGATDSAAPALIDAVALVPAHVTQSLPLITAPEAPLAPARGAPESLDVGATLLAIVCERTGYPLEMLDLDLDLEADLSIDSIKRVEILGAVAERLGVLANGGGDAMPDNLIAIKTLRGLIEALAPLAPSRSAAVTVTPPVEAAATPSAPAGHLPQEGPVPRYRVAMEATWHVDRAWNLHDRNISIVGATAPLESVLRRGLEGAGRHARTTGGAGDAVNTIDALIDLTPLRDDWTAGDVPALFGRVRSALVGGASHVLVVGAARSENGAHRESTVNGPAGPASGGVSGMIKSLRKEWPDRLVRIANFPAQLDDDALALHLLNELSSADAVGEVGYSQEGVRQTPRAVRADLNGERQAAPQVTLDAESVVLLTGGARGITAQVALELARRYACRLELVGRTPLPAVDEADYLRDAFTDVMVRAALARNNAALAPAKIEAACARVLAEREIRATMAALRDAGSEVNYQQLDVRDAAALGAFVKRLYARYGRLDGVIHGAGVIEDKLARDKTSESFARVFETKVNGALAIAENVRADIGFVVFFSSIASMFGNRGQADYAAANDYLDRLAVKLNRKLPGRVLSINWGPWRDAGMISDTLAREYARRGIDLIEPAAGVASFLEELLHGSLEDAQVILMRGDPAAMA